MITKEQIARINELYKKQKNCGLTDEEKKEQNLLRRLYIDSVKENLKAQLNNIKIVYPSKNHGPECDCGCKGHGHEDND